MARRFGIGLTLFAALLVIALSIPMVIMFRNAQYDELQLGLERDALVMSGDLAALPTKRWPAQIADYQRETGVRVTAVDDAGRIVSDSEGTPRGTQFTRPELSTALTGDIASGVRYSNTLNSELRYVAVPIQHGAEVIGAVRLSAPESAITASVRKLQYVLIGALALVVLAAILAAWAVSRALSRPLERLTDGARRVGADPSARVGDVGGPPEIQQVADAMDDTAAELDEMLTRSRAVATDASHHLRTPLAAMRLRLEAIADFASPDVAEQAEQAMVEVDRLTRRIDQVLAVATADVSATPALVDVAAIADRRSMDWQGMALDQGVDLLGEFSSAQVLAPLGEVDRIVDELIGNALTYAKTVVRVDVALADGQAVLRVTDDGPGIPIAEREHVFERFRRGSTAVPGGTGLGLSLVKQSAEKSGGQVRVLDSPVGASIEVRWTAARLGADAAKPRSGPSAGAATVGDPAGGTAPPSPRSAERPDSAPRTAAWTEHPDDLAPESGPAGPARA